jgi:predicted transcriptional regulator
MSSNGPPKLIPPPLELECLKALWSLEESGITEASVAAVRESLQSGRPLAYTTVMTLLDRLYRRQMVARRRQGRGYLYVARVSRGQMQHLALQQLIESLFSGDKTKLLETLGSESAPAPPAAAPELDATLL